MLSVQEAEARILALVQPLQALPDREWVDLASVRDRILAAEITGNLDFPAWDNSAMDGYAVRFADIQEASAAQPVALEVVEVIPAGVQPQQEVQPGEAARIFTGSMLPPGADTVVIQEQTQAQGNQVQIFHAPEAGANIRRRGAFYHAGQPLLLPGIRLRAAEIAVLATVQAGEIPVYRRPIVAILSTGSELIPPGQPLKPGQIIDSNQAALAALVEQTGSVARCLGVVGDRPEALKAAIAAAVSSADLVISSGGVSVGDYDYVEQSLSELGATIHLRSVAIRPGKPLTVATFAGTSANSSRPILYFGLPGNPVSALVSFWRFVQPALEKLAGLAQWQPCFVEARSRQDLHSNTQREVYLWGRLHLVQGCYEFELAGGSHSSGNLINLAQTNGLAVLRGDRPQILAGETVPVLQVGPPFTP